MRPLLSALGWTESKLVILIIRSRVLRRRQREVVRGVLGPWSASGGNLSARSRLVVSGNRGGEGGGGDLIAVGLGREGRVDGEGRRGRVWSAAGM